MSALDWPGLKTLRAWTPLSEVPASATHLGGVLYKLAPSVYVTCVSYNRRLEEVEGGLFVTMVLWAETDGAARRAQLMEIEADQHADVHPPPEMLLRGQPVIYGEILRELKRGNYGEFREWADYRVATDGAFVQRTVNIPPLSFYFRKLEEDDSERCYAIQYRLS
jgi:hypothetical protein